MLEALTQSKESLGTKLSFLPLESDGGTQHCAEFAQEARALLRVKLFGFADGSMMMGVAFLLDRSALVVDGQTVADQHAAEIFSQNLVEQIPSTALSNDIEGKLLISENPQPPAWAADPPAGLIAMKRRCLAQFCREGVVLGF